MFRCVVTVGLLAMGGCSSITSTVVKDPASADPGLVYYLPRKDIAVTVTVTAAGAADKPATKSITLGATPAYADLGEAYLLEYGRGLVAKNQLDVSVGTGGLLASAKSTSTSQLQQVFDAVSGIGPKKTIIAQPKNDCSAIGEHKYVIGIPDDLKECTGNSKAAIVPAGLAPQCATICKDVNVTVTRMWPSGAKGAQIKVKDPQSTWGRSGVYYRQSKPYLVHIDDAGLGVSAMGIVESPSESNALFLPISRTLIADNVATLTFSEGMPSRYEQDTDSEAVALLKLPAQILKAYFEAVGGMLSAIKDNKTAEADKVGAELKLELAKNQFQVCLAALQAKKTTDELKALGCTTDK